MAIVPGMMDSFVSWASIVLGLLGGTVALFAERRGWPRNQSRYRNEVAAVAESTSAPACGCGQATEPALATCSCAIAGALTIAKARVITIVIGTLWVGAIILGFAYNALTAIGVFYEGAAKGSTPWILRPDD